MKYIIGLFVTIGLLILLIVLLTMGGGSKTKVPNSSQTLESYANSSATVRLTVEGPINAPQDHLATRITVSRDMTTYEQIRGYDGGVVKTQSFPNTLSSYDSFLRAIELAGFTKGVTTDALKNDRGFCALGSRYIFELDDGGKQLERYWSSSCSGPKTFNGNTNLNITLFRKQVPNFNDFSNDLNGSSNPF